MTTAPDGYMYALNNAGTEFLKISENGTIQNLGPISQFVEKAKSFDQETAVYGGDMIADAFGNLYVISASQHVFKINPNKLSAEYLGQIKGLPGNYTVNGAAVERDGSILLGTSSQNGFYTLNIDTMEAASKLIMLCLFMIFQVLISFARMKWTRSAKTTATVCIRPSLRTVN